MAKREPPIAAFVIPLTDLQLIRLGRISAIWSQVDFYVDELLMRVHDLNPPQLKLLVGEKMVGSKIDLLARSMDHIEDGDKKSAIESFVKLASAGKSMRNHALHGVWGWKISSRGEFVAARHASAPATAFRPERLKRLEEEMAEASLAGQHALSFWLSVTFRQNGRFNFGTDERPTKRFGSNIQPLPSGRPFLGRKPKGQQPPLKS